MGNESSNRGNCKVYICVTLMMFALIAVELWLIIFRAAGTWNQKVNAVLAIVGAYGLAIGFFSKSEALAEFRDTLKDLTSPNILEYVSGNFRFLSYPPLFAVLAFSKYKTEGCPIMLSWLGTILCLALSPFLFVYVFFHVLVIMPLAYISTVLVSSIVTVIVYSGQDVAVSTGTKRVSIKNIVKRDQVAAKGFLIGIPGVVLSLLGTITALLIGK